MAAKVEHIGPARREDAGARLDKWLADGLPALSRARLKALILDGRVAAGAGAIADPAYRVKAGERFTVRVPEAAPANPAPEDILLDVVFEDDAVIVVNKPAGLVVHPAPGNRTGTLVNALLRHCGESLSGIGGVKRPGIVHRLDKDTSGLMVAAKNNAAHHALVADFAARRIKRTYTTLVWGVPRPRSGVIEGAIGRSPSNRKKMAVLSRGGRQARTRYSVLQSFGTAAALVACWLDSGRTHQIRVHLAHAGHPVVGDAVYGRAPAGRLRELAPQARAATAGLGRQFLHAGALEFRHPDSGKALRFTQDLPLELAYIIPTLGKTG